MKFNKFTGNYNISITVVVHFQVLKKSKYVLLHIRNIVLYTTVDCASFPIVFVTANIHVYFNMLDLQFANLLYM